MTPIVISLVVFGTFACVLHKYPLLIDESLSRRGFDYCHAHASLLIHLQWSLSSVHVVRRMSGAWLQRDDHVIAI